MLSKMLTGSEEELASMYLNHLRYADDIILISENPNELAEMLKKLNEASRVVGHMNLSKAKVMRVEGQTITNDGN